MRRFSARLILARSVAESPSDFHRTTTLGPAELLQELELNVLVRHKGKFVDQERHKFVVAQRFYCALSGSERAEWPPRAIASTGSLDYPDSITVNRCGIDSVAKRTAF